MNAVTTKVFIEYEQLQNKVNNLKSFIATPEMDDLAEESKRLLISQYAVMRPYLDVLRERLSYLLSENDNG
jgi:hypothetical protein